MKELLKWDFYCGDLLAFGIDLVISLDTVTKRSS